MQRLTIRILVISKHGETLHIIQNHVPRVGEKIGRFCYPLPIVTDVINFPENGFILKIMEKRIANFDAKKFAGFECDAIVLCE